MIDTLLSQTDCVVADRVQESLQNYVRALLARQQAMDLLETIHQQINQVWAVMRELLDGAGASAQAVRVARAALAVQAQNSYRLLEDRREECIVALHQAERRANAALQTMLASGKRQPSRRTRDLASSPRARHAQPMVCRATSRKSKSSLPDRC